MEQLSYFYDNGLSAETSAYQAAMRSFSLCFHSLLDIGINYDGWSKDRAAAFVRTCFDADDTLVEELLADPDRQSHKLSGVRRRICGDHGNAGGSRKKAGEPISAKEFHKFLLDLGPVLFSVTRKYFKLWLRQV